MADNDGKKKGLALFRRTKSDVQVAGDSTAARPAVAKAKSFKRIRGFLTGETRKERRARKLAEQQQSGGGTRPAPQRTRSAPVPQDDDAETVYGVDVDERSVSTAAPANKKEPPSAAAAAAAGTASNLLAAQTGVAEAAKAEADLVAEKVLSNYMLKVVLLLMDPDSRRFELLQLEFDSLKALVSDVLAQIPLSVTEEALRQQTYVGICGHDGKEMTPTQLLASFCRGNEVLVAVPQGLPAKECSRLAKPILSDDKVVAMLASSGIDASDWKDKKKSKSKTTSTSKELPVADTKKKADVATAPTSSAATTPTKTPAVESKPAKAASSTLLGKFMALILFFLLAMAVQVFHLYISAPIQPGHVVKPGIWMSKCGLLAFMPECQGQNQFLSMSQDGKLAVHNQQGQLMWQMTGGVCKETDANCTRGLEFRKDGTVMIGGKNVAQVYMYRDADLSPWPFSEVPFVKTVKK